MSNLTVYGLGKVEEAITKAATLRGKAQMVAAERIRAGLCALGFFIGVVYPLLTWVLS